MFHYNINIYTNIIIIILYMHKYTYNYFYEYVIILLTVIKPILVITIVYLTGNVIYLPIIIQQYWI